MDSALDVDFDDHSKQEEEAETKLAVLEAEEKDSQNELEKALQTMKKTRDDSKQAWDEELVDMAQVVEDTEREIRDLEGTESVLEYLPEEGIQFAHDLINQWGSK
jgi:hypothetical protein